MKMRLFRDESGMRRVETEAQYKQIADFLESDVQAHIGFCDEILTAISEIESGIRSAFETGGNAYVLVLQPCSARIEIAIDGVASEPGEFSLADIRQAISEWKSFLQAT